MNNVRTVSDTKKTFYSIHTRPINTIYRRVVEELMVEMHLLSVNTDFTYNPIYALGVATAFERFMQGYDPEKDKEQLFHALCQSVEIDTQKIKQEAHSLKDVAASMSVGDLISCLSRAKRFDNAGELQNQLDAIASNPKFKYSRLFAIGLFSLLEAASPETVKDEKQRNDALVSIAKGLNISEDKLSKDLDLYRSNLDKMAQAMVVMADMLAADRKKREQRAQQKSSVAATPSSEQ
ncbi:photosystem II biogenesis protein Psp29 [Calothrix sp. PCC 6303]|uniref:photosystem II biogenesis protein Psp29 n=1 Tax=Calothrix sp. PCC 6303 TaxID=1170562 RepID=UPI0002A006A6|nr:photosystem II biogenesis protein Psp29 [Calothrix sp. PCC 6303]AFZ04472.1 Protein thf1 [Calothrix sp. PCC 6303]